MGLQDNASDFIKSVGPKRAVVEGDTMETHTLKELIELDKYQRKTGPSLMKIRRAKFTQPGPTSRFTAPEC